MTIRRRQPLGVTAARRFALAAALTLVSSIAEAQTRSIEPDRPIPHLSLTFTARNSNFEQTSDEVPVTDLDFSATTWGAVFQLPTEWRGTGQFLIAYGKSGEKKLWEAELLAWLRIALGAPSRTEVSLLFPLFFSYRHLDLPASPTSDDALDVFRIGVGLGLGVASRLGNRSVLQVRLTPMVTMPVSMRQQDTFVPRADGMAEGSLLLHLERVFGNRVGLTVGGQIRVQRISVISEEFFPDDPDSWIGFRSVQPGLRLGIHW